MSENSFNGQRIDTIKNSLNLKLALATFFTQEQKTANPSNY